MGDIVRGNKLINAIHSIIHVTVCKMCYCNMCYWVGNKIQGHGTTASGIMSRDRYLLLSTFCTGPTQEDRND